MNEGRGMGSMRRRDLGLRKTTEVTRLVPNDPEEALPASPGQYLTRSGRAYLFQIRVPAGLAKERPLIRLSLGERQPGKARQKAKDLAAHARSLFDDVAVSPLNDPSCSVAGIKSQLKAYLSELDGGCDASAVPAPVAMTTADGLAEDVKRIAREAVEAFLLRAAEHVRMNSMVEPAGMAMTVPSLAGETPGAQDRDQCSGQGPSSQVNSMGCTTGGKDTSGPCGRDDQLPARTVGAPRRPAYLTDRRWVKRAPSSAPKFSDVVDDYLALRAASVGKQSRDIASARLRLSVFLELVGDHPVDRYEAADLQAFVLLMADWPARSTFRRAGTAQAVLTEARRDRTQPISEKSLRDGYVASVKAAMRSGMTSYSYRDPFQNAPIRYPSSLTKSRQTAPLSADQLSRIFHVGVHSRQMDQVMLPLLSHLTGRRLSALIYLRGRDIFEKYPGIWVAKPCDFVEINGEKRRVPIKTQESRKFFVLHGFLREIGFVEWAVRRKEQFLFPDLMRLQDPSKSASQYMQRLFEKAGVTAGRGEVFHSLRGDCIEELRGREIDARTIRLQVGHAVGSDEHSRYGSAAIQEAQAVALASVPLKANVDYSVFRGLNFEAISGNRRRKGVANSG